MGLWRFAKSRSTFECSIEIGCSGCAAVRGASRGYVCPKGLSFTDGPLETTTATPSCFHLLLGRRLGQSPTTSIQEVICDRLRNRDYLGRGAQASYRCPDRGRSRDRHRRVFEIPDQPLKQRCTKQGFSRAGPELDRLRRPLSLCADPVRVQGAVSRISLDGEPLQMGVREVIRMNQ
jgi:hypothetical protein